MNRLAFVYGYMLRCLLLLGGSLGVAQAGLWAQAGAVGAGGQDTTGQGLAAALAKAEKLGRAPLVAAAHWRLGKHYQQLGVFTKAMDHYNRGLAVLSPASRDTILVVLKNSIGSIYLDVEHFGTAEQFVTEALALADELNFPRGKAAALGLRGACYEKRGNYLEALAAQQKSLDLYEALGDQAGVAIANENIGSIYEDLQNYPLAFDYFDKAYSYLKSKGNASTINILNNIGDVYRKQGNYEQGTYFSLQALQLAEKLDDEDELQSAHKDLSKVYALQGDTVRAYRHLVDADYFSEQVEGQQDIYILNKMQFLSTQHQQEAQINLLKERNQMNEAYQRLQVLVILALLAVFFIGYYDHRRKRKTLLENQMLEKRALEAELEAKIAKEQQLELEVSLRTASLSSYSLHLAQKNKILLDIAQQLGHLAEHKNINYPKKIKALAREIDDNLGQESEWENFLHLFQDIHPDFIKQLLQIATETLSPAELRLAVLLKLNLSSKEIAAILRITPDSVRVARHRLRKKLPLTPKVELVNFLLALDGLA